MIVLFDPGTVLDTKGCQHSSNNLDTILGHFRRLLNDAIKNTLLELGGWMATKAKGAKLVE